MWGDEMLPYLFSIGEFHIRSWGLMVAIGILAGTLIARNLAKKEGLDGELILDYVLYSVIAGFLGARLWEVIYQLLSFGVAGCQFRGEWQEG